MILANYGTIASNDYLYVALSVNGIGYTIARALNDLVTAGLDSSSLCIISHSMGSQVAGYVGQYTNFKLPKIIGWFNSRSIQKSINENYVSKRLSGR